jgi:L-ascorbate metabolism protein UlaG (beta-lactamase superfamily)
VNGKISCTYVGQATTIIRAGGATILTDPHLGRRAFIARRLVPLPFEPGALPEPSCVLLSHMHCDHLDISSYKYISCGVPIIVPEGHWRAIGRYLPNPVIELSHFAAHELPDGTEITALPVIHSMSHIFDIGPSRANAYLVRMPGHDGAIYFCGDSAYGPHFRETGNLGRIALAVLPIGSYEPRWIMRHKHMTPAEAVNALEDLRAAHMIPIHHGTFRLSLEDPGAPLRWLERIVEERPDLRPRIHALPPGGSFELPALTTLTQVA